ncbi:hypothetical protein EV186_102193 [Labedaea rhizosphaerae]|uniref:Uncharacterized protein n=1 Tax=Labedaea rhizosphaerae TaxID=598644 RepID=A0A4R6SEJ3_LABRH|nr:hypothetical protein EV186_102193 [Labedaea rhizosphaerae]
MDRPVPAQHSTRPPGQIASKMNSYLADWAQTVNKSYAKQVSALP